jgi:hypothetical protein
VIRPDRTPVPIAENRDSNAGTTRSGYNRGMSDERPENSPESFEYRNVSVRRIRRGAFSFGSQKSSSRYAWRARVDARGRSHSVSAESVADIKEKIDAILDAP